MPIGPVQLLVVSFAEPQFRGEIIAELKRLRDSDVIRLIDALAVQKDLDGNLSAVQWSDLSVEESEEFGATVGALLGLGLAGDAGMEAGADRRGGGRRRWSCHRRVGSLGRRRHDRARRCRRHRADRARLGDTAARRDRERRRRPGQRRVGPSPRPGRDRPARRRRARAGLSPPTRTRSVTTTADAAHPDVRERRARGQRARSQTPPNSHTGWTPAPTGQTRCRCWRSRTARGTRTWSRCVTAGCSPPRSPSSGIGQDHG